MTFHKKTLARAVQLDGLGLHSGIPVQMTVHPSWDGIWFRTGAERVGASPENVTNTARCTKLGHISTVEHVMSALGGLEITDAEIELTEPEIPGMDGSAKAFVEAFMSVGFETGDVFEVPELYRRAFIHESDSKIAIAKGNGHWRYTFDTGDRWPGVQVCEYASVPDAYISEIAPARTIAFEMELPMIRQAGLGKGLDIDSALILGTDNYVNNARFSDEPARHKLLDLIGDLYLSGIPIRALSVVAEYSGHTANIIAAQLLKSSLTA